MFNDLLNIINPIQHMCYWYSHMKTYLINDIIFLKFQSSYYPEESFCNCGCET